ncbi:MAG: hypothetical protein HWN80_05830 [Candidatus Lokiarchaeota archaeon]|nr:hypothetical protein [Candidatus Lokiarchaeota archaeon]
MAIYHFIYSARRRCHAFFNPCAHVAQCLLQYTTIVDNSSGYCWMGVYR